MTTSISAIISETSSTWTAGRQDVRARAYVFKPAPKKLLVDGEIEFSALSESNLSKVRITPERARSIAYAPYSRDRSSRVVFESLGGYIDKNQIVHDWVGSRSWVPQAVPVYIVRIAGLEISSAGPRPFAPKHHFENVIVNAASGKIIVEITYD